MHFRGKFNKAIILLVFFSFVFMSIVNAQQKDQSKLKFYTEEFAPFNFKISDDSIGGQSTKIIYEIMKRLEVKYDIALKPWSVGYESTLKNGNTAIFSTFRTEERENLFKWVGPIGADEYMFFGLKEIYFNIRSLEEAKKISAIGVVKDDARYQLLKQDGFTNLVLYEDDIQAYKGLKNKIIDLVVGSIKTMPFMAKKAELDPTLLQKVYSIKKTPLYIAFNKNTDENIIKEWQITLDEMKQDGTYQKITGDEINVSNRKKSDISGMVSDATVVNLLSNLIDTKMNSYLEVLEILSKTEQVQTLNWKYIKPLIVAREDMAKEGRIWYLLPDGSYYTTVDDLTSKNLKTRGYFPGLMAGNNVLGPVVTSKSTGRTVGIVASPILINQKVKGALGTSIYLQDINSDLQKVLHFSSDQMYMALDQEGLIALHSDASLIGQNVSVVNPDLKEILEKDNGKIEFSFSGINWQANWKTAEKTRWKIVFAYKK